MRKNDSVVAVFSHSNEVAAAMHKLLNIGWVLGDISIAGKLYQLDEQPIGFHGHNGAITFWGRRGPFWTGLWTQFDGGVSLYLPTLIKIGVFGHLAEIVISALNGAIMTGGLTAFGASLSATGIPRESAVQYEQAVRAGGFLVIVHGSMHELERAVSALKSSAPTILDLHDGETEHFVTPPPIPALIPSLAP